MSNSEALRHPVTQRLLSDRRPHVLFKPTPKNQQLIARLSQLQQPFKPTPWLSNTHAQLVFHGLRKTWRKSDVLYDRIDRLTMADGGITALYWSGYATPAVTPTIVVMHTLTGSPESMAELVADLRAATGWRVVLCLRRGHGNLQLATPRFNILGSTDDLREQLQVIREHLPESPLYGVGSSAGSGLITRYLGEEGGDAVFRAAFAYCPGYDTDKAFDLAHPFYSRMMGKKLVKKFVLPNLDVIGHLSTIQQLQGVESLADFYRLGYELAGHASYADYDDASNPMRLFERIETPFMVLNAEDDPVCQIDNLAPYRAKMGDMPNLILVTTADGSHCAYYEGWRARSWSAKLMADYFAQVHAEA
ncbi:alpha/beta fold hydrolase [Marinobacter nanhaiticus D15-8W]|uniref:Alpha/beta fold hydrolase n=1 Tax=Marinobacter nanhaiticus D15-8W TaxID=626887 RepID=N6WY34_9GAMM|nr:alpha/beta fold hydrolase [Marinobacter nanhaiticus]ENO16012.1 alpha/beta fold hydrolase [Marinobacter nanhaiticus D15-8W]